jgi:D-sedoheptulose 7-phosphate isomerase
MSNDNSILNSLYPFTAEKSEAPAEENGASVKTQFNVDDSVLLTSIEEKANESIEVKKRYFDDNRQALLDASKTIAEMYINKGKLLTMGNGGSNCDASHLAVEFLHPVTAGRSALPAINLGADSTMVTAASNDLGYENVFVRQLIAHSNEGDVLVGFSTSGSSDNLMNAFRKAKELGLHTIAFSGMNGGDMVKSRFVDINLNVPSFSIHRIQESHLTTYHILWDLVHSLLADYRQGQVK